METIIFCFASLFMVVVVAVNINVVVVELRLFKDIFRNSLIFDRGN